MSQDNIWPSALWWGGVRLSEGRDPYIFACVCLFVCVIHAEYVHCTASGCLAAWVQCIVLVYLFALFMRSMCIVLLLAAWVHFIVDLWFGYLFAYATKHELSQLCFPYFNGQENMFRLLIGCWGRGDYMFAWICIALLWRWQHDMVSWSMLATSQQSNV